jgi:signal transduction histidine kinase
MNLSLELIVIIVTSVVSASLGAIVFLRDRRSATHISFFAFTLIIAGWLITNYFSLHSPTPAETLFWIRAVMTITSFLGITLFFFLFAYPRRKLPVSPVITILLLVAGTVVSIVSQTPFLFESVSIIDGNITPKPGPLFPLFLLVFLPPIIVGFISLFRKYRKSVGIERIQIRYLFVGSFLTFSLLIFTNLVLAIFIQSSKFVFFGPLFSLIMLGAITYAILKHRLLNISALIARTVSYAFLIAVISALYSLAFFGVVYVLFPTAFTNRETTLLFSSFLALLVGFTLPSLQSLLEKWTDRLLYKTKTDERHIFAEVANLITSTFDLDTLANQLTTLLYKNLRTTYAKVILFGDQETFFFESAGDHTQKIDTEHVELLQKSTLDLVVFEETEDPHLKEWMRTYEISVIINLKVKSDIIGCILLGNKASGEIFYEEDLSFLPTLADQVAVAFENALAVRQIAQFNETLKAEIAKATEDLRKANEELKALDHLKDEFLSMASHELKSPMNAVKNYLWMALNKGLDDKEKQKGYLGVAYESIQRLISLVNDLLDVSRIESGRVTLQIVPIDLTKAISETIEIFEPQAKAKGLSLTSTLTEPVQVKADDTKLREILNNLVSNAIKYTPTGSVAVTVSTRDQMVRVSVTDTGAGITGEDQQKLFQKFSRVNSSYKGLAAIEGTGLGLYISKQFVEMMGGTIGLDSAEGKGSTFWIELPKA